MALDDAGALHLAYCLVGDSPPRCNAVGYARKVTDTWQLETIREGCASLGEGAALALATSGQAFVAYQGCDAELTLAAQNLN
jgi:hypothetical protein